MEAVIIIKMKRMDLKFNYLMNGMITVLFNNLLQFSKMEQKQTISGSFIFMMFLNEKCEQVLIFSPMDGRLLFKLLL
jgi:hypothetical protein